MIRDGIEAKGKLTVEINGEIVREIDNLVVAVGKNFVASRMVGVASDVMSHMAIGSGSTAAASGDTALETEEGRVALSSASASSADVTYSANFPAGTGTATITEAGILNAASSGTLLCRTVFSAVTKGAADSMTITWTVTVS